MVRSPPRTTSRSCTCLRFVGDGFKHTEVKARFSKFLHNNKFSIPQKPYFSQRSLRSQISFPALPLEEDDVFIKCLERLDLLSVLDETVFKQNTKPETSLRQRFANRGKTRLVDEEISLLDRIPEKSWYDILSPGKLQLLAFARVLYHTPHLVLLDEATSAVSPELAGRMYGMLKELGIG